MKLALILILFAAFFGGAAMANAQTTTFTYQGKLGDGANASPSGSYKMKFALFGSVSGSDQIGSTLAFDGAAGNFAAVSVANGVFSVRLDFGASAFPANAARYLEISVFNQTTNGYVTLAPRQELIAAPFSIRTLNANAADSLSNACIMCVTDAQIAAVDGSKVTGTVTSATTAAIAGNVSGIVPIANGGTGSATQNFVDLTTDQTVGGNKTFTGNLAVGGTLETSGDVKIPAAKDYQYATAQTRYYSVSATAFNSESSAYGRGLVGGNIYSDNGTTGVAAYFLAPVYLPDGATVTAVTFYAADNDATYDILFGQLWRNDASTTTQYGNSMLMAQTPGTSGNITNIQMLSTVSITGPLISNQSYTYYLRWGTRQNNSNLRLAKALITYTVSKAN